MLIVLRVVLPIMLTVATPAAAAVWPDVLPVDDATLSAVVGKTAATTRLSAFVNEQGSIQSQFTGENLRTIFANWFADGSVQLLANDSIRRGVNTPN